MWILCRSPIGRYPAGDVLLILNADPEGLVANGYNIAADAQEMDTEQADTEQTEAQETEAQEMEAQHPYFVAPDLQLPKTPYLLILRHAREGKNGTPDAIEDVAGNYFRSVHNTEVWPLSHTLRPSAPAAPLSTAGTWQREECTPPAVISPAHGEPSNHRWFTHIHPTHLPTLPDDTAAHFQQNP